MLCDHRTLKTFCEESNCLKTIVGCITHYKIHDSEAPKLIYYAADCNIFCNWAKFHYTGPFLSPALFLAVVIRRLKL